MKNETIKVGEITYDIANGSCSLDIYDSGSPSVAIIIGSNTLDSILKTVSESPAIVKYDRDGKEEWRRDDLVYTGQMAPRSDFPVGIEQRQTGTDDEGNPIYVYEEAKGAVVIVEYRTPTMQDRLKAQEQRITELNAQLAYLQMMSGIEEV